MSLKTTLILLFCFLFFSSYAFADGGVFYYDYDTSSWNLQDMDGQACAINYENGLENMILSVNVNNLQGEKAVWIFPVPSKPEDTKIDIVKEFPKFHGYDVEMRANKEISDTFDLMKISQIFNLNSFYFFNKFIILTQTLGLKSASDLDKEIQIHSHIEKTGIITELVTAKNISSLSNYLSKRELQLPDDFDLILDEYIGRDYSFVISWISDVEEFKKSQPIAYMKEVLEEKNTIEEIKNTLEDFINKTETKETIIFQMALDNINDELRNYELYTYPRIKNKKNELIIKIRMRDSIIRYNNALFNYKYAIRTYLSFPTDKIYFPLKTTSIYGDKEIPMLVYVINYVEPEFYKEIKEYAKVNYFLQKEYEVPNKLKFFFNDKNTIKNLKYTKIKINSPSLYLIDDLWINDSTSTKIILKEYISKYAWFLGIILFILCSCLASMISGMVIFRKDQPDISIFFSLSIEFAEKIAIPIAFFALYFLFIFPFIYGIYNNRKLLKFIILFSVVFLILIYILQILMGFII
ncbi:MAG: hypothetical protein B6U87_01035 [Candidatus Aenigmarchaeota archaeon ex4484_52]|nr:MAG: hypothetical protein B6U87_01035 [Candidatus Aenigmarchaeota archaeon ex4484_52]